MQFVRPSCLPEQSSSHFSNCILSKDIWNESGYWETPWSKAQCLCIWYQRCYLDGGSRHSNWESPWSIWRICSPQDQSINIFGLRKCWEAMNLNREKSCFVYSSSQEFPEDYFRCRRSRFRSIVRNWKCLHLHECKVRDMIHQDTGLMSQCCEWSCCRANCQ